LPSDELCIIGYGKMPKATSKALDVSIFVCPDILNAWYGICGAAGISLWFAYVIGMVGSAGWNAVSSTR
jgi:hypothetical protein